MVTNVFVGNLKNYFLKLLFIFQYFKKPKFKERGLVYGMVSLSKDGLIIWDKAMLGKLRLAYKGSKLKFSSQLFSRFFRSLYFFRRLTLRS